MSSTNPIVSMIAPLKIFVCLLAFSLAAQISQANPADFTVHSATGTNVFKLSEAKGKFVVVHFLLKTECPYCLRHTQAYARKAADDARVVQIFLKPDTVGEIKQWAARLGEEAPKLPIYRDPEAALAKAYGIPDGYKFHGQTVHFPALLILDRSGKEVFRYVGKSNADRFPLEKYSTKLEALIGP